MKKCSKCGEVKPLSVFPQGKRVCDSCTRARQAAWREANREKLQQYHKQRYESQRPQILERAKRYYAANKKTISSRNSQYYQSTLPQRREAERKYYSANREHLLEYSKNWHATARMQLSDCYLRALICQGSDLTAVQVPQALVRQKREQLRLHRLTKELQQAINERIDHEQG